MAEGEWQQQYQQVMVKFKTSAQQIREREREGESAHKMIACRFFFLIKYYLKLFTQA